MKYKLLTPSGVETDDTWDNVESIPIRAADRLERYFETEEAELIQIDDEGNHKNLGYLIDNDSKRVSRMNKV
jgi:hypothetical protein